MSNIYTFPVGNRFDAREVTEPDFDILGLEEELYVDLSSVRSTDYLDYIREQLAFSDGVLVRPVNQYPKILFSGYKGSGKTLELRKLQKELNQEKGYISILVEAENELEISKFKPEDFFVILITKLVKRLYDEKIKFSAIALKDLQTEWLSEKEVIKELNEINREEGDLGIQVGFDLLGFLKLGTGLKGLFANETKTSEVIRRKIVANTPLLIQKLNLALTEIRESLKKEKNKAKDIVFIFDGSEKINFQVYEQLFINNAEQINKINLSIIAAVPILTFYKVSHRPALDFYDRQLLPMIKPSPESNQKFKEILARRLHLEAFMTDTACELIIEKAGGSIRQMLKIVNSAIIGARGNIIDVDLLNTKILKKLHDEIYDALTSAHKDILNHKKYIDERNKSNIADEIVWELVYGLVLFRYNGTIRINPLIESSFQ